MKVLRYSDSGFASFVKKMKRRALPSDDLYQQVSAIISDVKKSGDSALLALTKKFDGAVLSNKNMFVSELEFSQAEKITPQSTHDAIAASLRNIHAFAKKSMRKDWQMKNEQGAMVGERFMPFSRVGVYVPGGKAPLVSTALMTAGIAQAVGVPQILACTPAGADGKVNAALLCALRAAGATEVLKIGGAQAIAAMALGTKNVRAVERIFGPGNRYVVEAKRQLVGAVAIDLLPGPSEILILSDQTGNAKCIAADILAQAEHGGDSEVGFITDSQKLLEKVQLEISEQLKKLSRGNYIEKVLAKGTFLLLVKNLTDGVALVNDYAPEHLSLIAKNAEKLLPQIISSGAIYVGNSSPVAVGDFLAGPSHTLPTGGSGRSFSGIRADQFQRRTSIVTMDEKAVRKSLPIIEEFGRIEGLDAHARSVAIRLEK